MDARTGGLIKDILDEVFGDAATQGDVALLAIQVAAYKVDEAAGHDDETLRQSLLVLKHFTQMALDLI